MYCGVQCQQADWSRAHQFECVGAGTKRDKPDDEAGEEEEEEDVNERPVKQQDATKKQEPVLDLNTILKSDAGPKLLRYLEADDLKELKVANPEVLRNQRIRKTHFQQFRVDPVMDLGLVWQNDSRDIILLIDKYIIFRTRDIIDILAIKNNYVKDIQFTRDFNDPSVIPVLSQARGLTHLAFGRLFNQPLTNLHCEQLTYLRTGYDFDSPVIGMNTPKLTHLLFGNDFNQPIIGLALPNLQDIDFGDNYSFDQPIIGFNAPKLTRLVFGMTFNQPIIGFDAPKLTTLIFGARFNQPIVQFTIPRIQFEAPNLQKLCFGLRFNQHFIGFKAPNLSLVKFDANFTYPILGKGTPNVKTLLFDGTHSATVVTMPLPSVERLVIYESGRTQISSILFPSITEVIYPSRIYNNGNYEAHKTIRLVNGKLEITYN